MRGRKEMNPDKRRSSAARVKRVTALALAAMMVINVPTPVQAFSFKKAFSSITSSISNTVKAVKKVTDSSSSKTVYNYSELKDFMTSFFAPTDITVKLGADITVPSGEYIYSLLHNVKMDMNNHTIYSNSADGVFSISSGHRYDVKNGTIVQKVNTTKAMVYMFNGDMSFENVTFKKSSSATNVTGVKLNGALGTPKATFDKCTWNGLTTGITLNRVGHITVTNSTIYNTQGDAVKLENYMGTLENDIQNSFTMTGGSIKYFKGNGIAAGAGTQATLSNVTVTGGTTRNRYGIRAEKGADVKLNQGTSVKDNVGGNIAVNKYYAEDGIKDEGVLAADKCPVEIDAVDQGSYSFTIMDKISSADTKAYTVAKVASAYNKDVESYDVYSDISRYMVLAGNNNKTIEIQNPPEQCAITVEIEWQGKTTATEEEKNGCATVCVNGVENVTDATTKYAQMVTLSTTNKDPELYEFVGWQKYKDGEVSGAIIKGSPTYKVKAVDANATYKAIYRNKTYTLTVKASGKGSVTLSSGTCVEQSNNEYKFYAGDTVAFTAADNTTGGITYKFKKWSDGTSENKHTFTVTADATYTALFKKTGKEIGTMYLGVEEVTDSKNIAPETKLLLVYIGKAGATQNKPIDTSTGKVGITGIPDNSAKITAGIWDGGHERSAASGLGNDNINGYGKGVTPKASMRRVEVPDDGRGAGFDGCKYGYVEKDTFINYEGNSETCWLYWCGGGKVKAAGPYALYSYTSSQSFNINDVKISMSDDYVEKNMIGRGEQTVDEKAIKAQVTVDGETYTLSGLTFGGDSEGLDSNIDYVNGDKLISFELDGATMDYSFPEAMIGDSQYESLSEAITKADTGKTIKIVGPGVDAISGDKNLTLNDGVSIQGYDGNTVKAVGNSTVGVDKDGMVRLIEGELEVNPQGNKETSVGVKDAFATTDKTIHVKADGGNAYIVPDEADTKLTISPDNNAEHTVEITGTKAKVNYGFKEMENYDGETVSIKKETEYTINLPKNDGETSAPTITTSKYNTGDTVIKSSGDNRMPEISSSAEGDKITVGGKTYVTGPVDNNKSTKYRVDPSEGAVPNVILEEGSLGIPKGSTIKVGETIIENTGAGADAGNTVQVNANGEIEVPDGGGVSINGVKISVPSATPMNGNTKITLDKDGKPHITTTGNSDITITVSGKNGESEQTYTYTAGDYDCELEIGEDGVPVLKNGDVILSKGTIIKDSEGNEYTGDASNSSNITIMTSPKVYDENNGLIGGGDIGFDLPQSAKLNYKPNGDKEYKQFENPGDSDGYFTMDPAKAAKGPQADSELGIVAGKDINISTGNGTTINVKAPNSNAGKIIVDGSTGDVTISKSGDKVEIDGKTYEAAKANTVLNVDENGVSLVSGGVKVDKNGISTGSVKVTAPDSSMDSVELVRETTGSESQQTKIAVSGENSFTIASTSDATAEVTLAPEGVGEHEYVVNEDGSISVPNGETIVCKGEGLLKKDVKIKSGDNNTINVKPLGKPDEKNVESGVSTPASGLIVEVPIDGTATIGGKTYTAKDIENGYTASGSAGGADKTKLPLQLVVDENGDVILNDGTVELDKGTDISVFDVNNKLATIKNESEGDQKIDVTKPGIITMPKADTTVSMQEEGSAKTTITSTKDDTQLIYSPEISALKKGGVSLSKDDKIMVGDTIIKNTSVGDKQITVERTETTKEVTDTDGTKREELVYNGTVTVPEGGCFEASYPGAENTVSFAGTADSSVFEINEDGNFVMPDGAITSINKGSDKQVDILINNAKDAAGKETGKVESMPTPDGILYAIPNGGSITVNGQKYTNTSNETLVLSVNSDGKVILVQGEVNITEGSIIYVENEKEGLVPIKNQTNSASGEDPATESAIKVSYDGVQQNTDQDGQVTGTSYSNKVKIEAPKDTTVAVGTNVYENTTSNGASGGTTAKINLDLTKDDSDSISKNNISGSKVELETGSVSMDKGSSISVGKADSKKVISNIGSPDPEPGAANASDSVQVNADATLKLPTNSGVISKDASGKETKIQVPKKDAERSDDYQAEVNLNKNGESEAEGTVEIKLTPTGEGTTGGSGNTIRINDGTYISKETDNNLTLELDTKKNEVSMAGSTTKVGLADNASVTVGNTTVKAGTEDDKVIEVTADKAKNVSGDAPKVSTIDIPGGGQANIKNPKTDQDMTVSVPEKKSEEGQADNKQTINVDPNGNLSTNLKKDETVVIGGIEYTGTADENTDNNIIVDGKTGSLVSGSGGAETPKVDAKIDADKFNNPNYSYTIPGGSSVSVNGVDYVAPEGNDIILTGNPDGNPVIKIKDAGGTITIGGKKYTAGTADSKFTVDNSGNIILMDNENQDANSSIKLAGSEAQKVNGVSYRGSSQEDSYTITYKEDGCVVEPAEGTKLSVDMPADSKIYVKGNGAVDTVNDAGEKVTETFDGPLPISMTGGSGSIYLDNSVQDAMGTTYVSVNGSADMELDYTDEGDTKKLTGIKIKTKKSSSSSQNGDTKEKLDSVSSVVKDALAKLSVSKVTSKEELETAIRNALAKTDATDVTYEITEFNKVDPTKKAEGKVTGTIRISLNGVDTLIPFSYTLAKVTGDQTDTTTAQKEKLFVTAKSGNKKVKLSWKKETGATGYEVYTSVCDGGKNFKKTETKKLTSTIKNLSNKKSYKFYVRAYKVVKGKKVYLGKSPMVHVAMKNYKYTNVKAIKNVKSGYKLETGKKVRIRATAVKNDKNKKLLAHSAEFRYYSSDTSVATVSNNGVITAKKAGKCTVYVVANNGVYKTSKVTVGE